MEQQQVILVQRTWKLFRDIKPEIIGDVFYSKLFTEFPASRRMFKNDITAQYKKLVDMLSLMVGRLQQLHELTADIRALAIRHAGYGVKPAHYAIVGDTLLWTLEQGLGPAFTPEVKAAWTSVYGVLSHTMIDAMERLPKAA